jgi:hypothetical protein
VDGAAGSGMPGTATGRRRGNVGAVIGTVSYWAATIYAVSSSRSLPGGRQHGIAGVTKRVLWSIVTSGDSAREGET